MSTVYQSLSHSRWDCKYHVIFVSKRRQKVLYGELRQKLKEIFHELARQKGVPDYRRASDAGSCPYGDRDTAERLWRAVSAVIGFLKDKSAIAVACLQGKGRNFGGEHLWARGYAVSTVGFELDDVQRYVRE